jgi:hypothetical protein
MKKVIGYTNFWLFVFCSLASIWALLYIQNVILIFLPLAVTTGYFLFKDSLNLVQGIGFVYWITRDTHKGFSVSFGFMRETDYPWRTGKGIQIGIGKYVFQTGFCRRNAVLNETMGLYNVVKGRELQHTPKEIGTWR